MTRWYTDQVRRPSGTNKDNKYHAKKTEIDGHVFDSEAEADYYLDLKLLQKSGEVVGFELQPEFELLQAFTYKGRKFRAVKYRADFIVEYKDGHVEVVDVKGKATREYIIKKKLLLCKYPEINFIEVRT